jgi:hypothetical protein
LANWQTISALATAAGTLVLAVATFWAVRSSNRSARIAEQALRAGLRPLLVHGRRDDPEQKVLWQDQHHARLRGNGAVLDTGDDAVYLAMSLRNVGAGIALLHGWYPTEGRAMADTPHADPDEFRRLTIDLYIPPGDAGYWEGAVRASGDPQCERFRRIAKDREPFSVDLLYGDQDGGQRTISRFTVLPAGDEGWYCLASRHWPVEGPPPR